MQPNHCPDPPSPHQPGAAAVLPPASPRRHLRTAHLTAVVLVPLRVRQLRTVGELTTERMIKIAKAKLDKRHERLVADRERGSRGAPGQGGRLVSPGQGTREKMPDDFQKSIEDEEEVSTEPCWALCLVVRFRLRAWRHCRVVVDRRNAACSTCR